MYTPDKFNPLVLSMLQLMKFSPNATIAYKNGLEYTALDWAMIVPENEELVALLKDMGAKSYLSDDEKISATQQFAIISARASVYDQELIVAKFREKLIDAETELGKRQSHLESLLRVRSPQKRSAEDDLQNSKKRLTLTTDA